MKTLNKTIVLVYVFFSSHKLLKNASFPFCLRFHGAVCTRLWEKTPRQAHNRKHKAPKKVRDFDKYHVQVNNVGCLDDKSVSDIIFIMKTYYWPPWPWLRKTFDKHCVKLSSTTSTDAPILYRWLKHYVRKKTRWKTVCPKSCDRWQCFTTQQVVQRDTSEWILFPLHQILNSQFEGMLTPAWFTNLRSL